MCSLLVLLSIFYRFVCKFELSLVIFGFHDIFKDRGNNNMNKKSFDNTCSEVFIHKEIVDKTIGEMPELDNIKSLSLFFKAISDETRIRIICALNINELCVCDLTAVLQMTKSAISHQLRTLRNAGIVKNRKVGKVVYYSLVDEHVRQIVETSLDHINE